MDRTDPRRLYAIAALASLLLSLLAVLQNPYINQDGVHYLRALDDAASAHSIGHWLFYSGLIQGLSRITGLTPEIAAHLLDAMLDLTTVLAFVRLMQQLGARGSTLAWSALLILLLPYFNGNRAEIIRDHGYWAFTLLALNAWLALLQRFGWRPLLAWSGWMGLATAFRVEGVVFLLGMPLTLLLEPLPPSERLRRTVRALLPVALLALAVLPWLLWGEGHRTRLAHLLIQAQQLPGEWSDSLSGHARALRQALPDLSATGAWLLLGMAAMLAIVKDLGDALSWPLLVTVLLRRRFHAPAPPEAYRRLLTAYGALSLLVLWVQEAWHFVMVSRYTLALALALLPLAVLTFDALWRRRRSGTAPRWQQWFVLLTLLWLAGDTLINRNAPKPWLTDAGRWAARHLPAGSRVLTDYDPLRLEYYARRAGATGLWFQRYRGAATPLAQYDHAFVRRSSSGLGGRLRRMGLKPEVALKRKERQVQIFRLRHEGAPMHERLPQPMQDLPAHR